MTVKDHKTQFLNKGTLKVLDTLERKHVKLCYWQYCDQKVNEDLHTSAAMACEDT